MSQAATFIQKATATAGIGSTISATFGSNTANGNMIVVVLANNCNGSPFTATVSDTQGGSYTLMSGTYYTNSASGLLWVATGITGGATTVTVSGFNTGGINSGAPSLIIAEYKPSTSYVIFGSGFNPIPGNQNAGLDQGNPNCRAWAGACGAVGTPGSGTLVFNSANLRTNWHIAAIQVVQPFTDSTIIALQYDSGGFAFQDVWTGTPGNIRASTLESNNQDALVLADFDFLFSGPGPPPPGGLKTYLDSAAQCNFCF